MAVRTRVRVGERTERASERAEVADRIAGARRAGDRLGQVPPDVLDHQPNQVAPPVDMLVERRRPHADGIGDALHRHRLEPIGLEHGAAGSDDRLERRSSGCRHGSILHQAIDISHHGYVS